MVTKESLQIQYAKLETYALLEIISYNSGYTELAVSVALDELKRRNVPLEDIEQHQEVDLREIDPLIVENYLIDLTFFQKIAFYVFWFVWITRLGRFIRRDVFRENGYILRSQQQRYYYISGFVFSLSAIACNSLYTNSGWFVWFIGFFVAYFFDTLFNNAKQVKKLEAIMESGGDFEWD